MVSISNHRDPHKLIVVSRGQASLGLVVVGLLLTCLFLQSSNTNLDPLIIQRDCLTQSQAAVDPVPASAVVESRTLNQNIVEKTTATTSSSSTPAIMTDSTNATVMGFATGYGLGVYKRFVGSLRNSGFKGHIILAVAPDLPEDVADYFASRRVEYHRVEFVPCTHGMFDDEKDQDVTKMDSHKKEARRCVAPYTNLKARWGRFPFLRERLKACAACTGPVLITDVRDTFFQRDPFGSGHPVVEGLQVMEEYATMTTQNWLAEWPIRECRGVTYQEVMLCSGTTIGTRQAMIDYLNAMEEEMNLWMQDKKCHFKINGDDQSIHNYLFYAGKLPYAKAIKNRQGIVHTIGNQAAMILNGHKDKIKKMRELLKDDRFNMPFDGAIPHKGQWLGLGYGLADEQGFIIDLDFNRSAVVHQYDRFGGDLENWLMTKSGLVDK